MENATQKYVAIAIFGILMVVSVVQAVQLWSINSALSKVGYNSADRSYASQSSDQDVNQASVSTAESGASGAQMVGGC